MTFEIKCDFEMMRAMKCRQPESFTQTKLGINMGCQKQHLNH